MERIVLFDDECIFCNKAVHFILNRDHKKLYYFVALESIKGKEIKEKFSLPPDIDSFFLVKDNKVYDRSTAALQVFKDLKGPIKLLSIFLFIPKSIRDLVYRVIAKNRYRLTRNSNYCLLPSKEHRKRFYF